MAGGENTGWVAQASTLSGPPFPQQLAPLGDRAAGVDHVVDQNCGFASHITDHGQALGHVVTGASFVDDRQWRIVHALGEARALATPPTSGETTTTSPRSRAER